MVGHRHVLRLCTMTALLVFFFSTYVIYFRHPAPGVIVRLNRDVGDIRKQLANHKSNGGGFELSDTALDDGALSGGQDTLAGVEFWDNFLRTNNFVSVGSVYDKCDGRRTQVGAVILEEDQQNGGLGTRTFLNLTLDRELEGGEFHLEVKYNGRDLYDNYWELCELEDRLPAENRTFTCPVAAGKWSKVKSKHVPSYLPSGRYQTKAWAVDDRQRMIACGFSDFQL